MTVDIKTSLFADIITLYIQDLNNSTREILKPKYSAKYQDTNKNKKKSNVPINQK